MNNRSFIVDTVSNFVNKFDLAILKIPTEGHEKILADTKNIADYEVLTMTCASITT